MALAFLGIITPISITSVVYYDPNVPDGLIAISSAGIGALAALFSANK